MAAGNTTIQKPREQWSKEEKRLVQYNLKAKNIITSTLGMDDYFRVSNCKSAKDMWDTLQVTHKGTTDVKISRINTLTREYELFRMNPNENLINKVLRCLSREWQPKVTAIIESWDLTNMSLATLCGDLQEQEMELLWLNQHEENDKKKKGIALKASPSNQEES